MKHINTNEIKQKHCKPIYLIICVWSTFYHTYCQQIFIKCLLFVRHSRKPVWKTDLELYGILIHLLSFFRLSSQVEMFDSIVFSLHTWAQSYIIGNTQGPARSQGIQTQSRMSWILKMEQFWWRRENELRRREFIANIYYIHLTPHLFQNSLYYLLVHF